MNRDSSTSISIDGLEHILEVLNVNVLEEELNKLLDLLAHLDCLQVLFDFLLRHMLCVFNGKRSSLECFFSIMKPLHLVDWSGMARSSSVVVHQLLSHTFDDLMNFFFSSSIELFFSIIFLVSLHVTFSGGFFTFSHAGYFTFSSRFISSHASL